MQHAPCIECGEAVFPSVPDFGVWHSHCATLALSSLLADRPRECPKCGELAPRNVLGAHESITDYNDRRWHLGCAVDALEALIAARRRALLMPTGRAPERVEHFAGEVWARLVDDLCPSPGIGEHGPLVSPARFRHECHACIEEDRTWLSERALQLVADHLGRALRLFAGGERRPSRVKAPD